MADAAIQGHDEHERGFFTRWFMSVNHKDIGILYIVTASVLGILSVPRPRRHFGIDAEAERLR